MKTGDRDDLWPRPQWYSIICPKCGRPADMTGSRNVGRVVDKLTREKMLALKGGENHDAD